MMRSLIFAVLCFALFFSLDLASVRAEEGKVDVSKWITLTVKHGAKIKLEFAASTANTWVRVAGVKDEKKELAPEYLKHNQRQYEAIGTEIKVYGALDQFACYENGDLLTDLDPRANTILFSLICSDNQLVTLDVKANKSLQTLVCGENRLTSLDVTENKVLRQLGCFSNVLTTLDVTKNKELKVLDCAANQLTELDISACEELDNLNCADNLLTTLDLTKSKDLMRLFCNNNQLVSLDIKGNPNLQNIVIYGNNFSTNTLNNIYCQLPQRPQLEKGIIYPVNNNGDALDELLTKSTSKTITDAKNWLIQYWKNKSDIEGITGKHTCGSAYALTFTPATRPNPFSYQGGEWQTTVTSTGHWKLDETTPLPDWLTVAPKEGNSATQITITATPNTSNNYRKNALTFVLNSDPNIKQVLILSQEKRPSLFISVAPTDYTFPIEGESKKLTVESSGAWTITNSNAAWNPVESISGNSGLSQVILKAEKNTGAERITELTFTLKDHENVKQIVTLKQTGASISVTPAAGYTFPMAGETKENYFTVESTGEWTVTSSNTEWFPIEKKVGPAGTTKVTIKADANTGAERNTNLTFWVKDTDIKQVVSLKQEGKSNNPNPPAPEPNAVADVIFASIFVTPNPFSTQLRISNSEAINARYELINANGLVVRSGDLQDTETILNTENLAAGIYLLHLTTPNGTTKVYSVLKY